MDNKNTGFDSIVNAYLFSIILYVIYGMIYYKISLKSDILYICGISTNMFLYGVGSVVFILLFGVFYCFFEKKQFRIKYLSIIAPVLSVGVFYIHYHHEIDEFASQKNLLLRHDDIFKYFYFVLIIIICVFVKHAKIKLESNNRSIRLLIAIVLPAVIFMILFFPDFMSDKLGSYNHFSAYVTSIIGITDLQPYSDIFYSIYGHYGLFFIIPVKLLELTGMNQLYSIITVISISGFIMVISLIYVIHKLISDDMTFILTSFFAIAAFTMYYINGEYYQLFPHRFLFPAIMTAFVVYEFYKKQDVCNYFAYVLLMLSFLWNIETGIVCFVAYICFKTIRKISENVTFKKLLSQVLSEIILGMFSFFFSFLFTNIYNYIVGGNPITFRRYIYLFFSEEYKIFELIRTPVNKIGNLWFIETVLFLAVISYTFVWIKKKKDECKCLNCYPIWYFMALTGMGLLADYINRSAALSATLSLPWFAILTGCICEHFMNLLSNADTLCINKSTYKLISTIRYIFCCILLISFVSGFCYIGISFGSRQSEKGGGWDYIYMNTIANNVNSYVPDDAIAVGHSISLVYCMIGRKPQLYTVDIGDMQVDDRAQNTLYEEMKKNGTVVVDNSAYVVFPQIKTEWDLIQSVPDTNFSVYEYKR